jgi:hypothetical protein
MAIEKLERYNDYEERGDGHVQQPEKDGNYVLYSKARAREVSLLEALKKIDSYLDFSTPIERHKPINIEAVDGVNAAFADAREVIRQIEETK